MSDYDYMPRITRWWLCFWFGHLPEEYNIPHWYCPRCEKVVR